MSHIAKLGALGATAVIATAFAVAPAVAGSGATLTVPGSTTFKANQYVKDSVRWSPGTVTIASGGTLSIDNKGEEPHTFSIVKSSDVPRSTKQFEQCKICDKIAKGHGVSEASMGPPKHPVLDVGAKGIDQAGDSVVFIKDTKVVVSAKPGTTLSFICAIHPWMQGKLVVR